MKSIFKNLCFALCALASFMLASCDGAVGVDPAKFDAKVQNDSVHLYTLVNENGMAVQITNYGGRVVSILLDDKDGVRRDVVLGHDSIQDYVAIDGNFGALIGRYGNRIAKGQFTLDGNTYQLPINDNGHSLHGGPIGFHHRVWKVDSVADNMLALLLTSVDGEAGYPGTLDVKVVYTLTNDNALDIAYSATTTKPTIVNLTNHSYFNMSGDASVNLLDEEMMISADSITPIDATFMTDGSMMAVKGTPFDFTQPKAIGDAVNATDNEQIKNGLGVDHNFVLNTKGDISKVAASLFSPKTGIKMEVYTTEPGLQVYSGNFLDGKVIGKYGVAYVKNSAMALETQHYPNSPNCPQYPSTVLRPGETYSTHTIYKFVVEK